MVHAVALQEMKQFGLSVYEVCVGDMALGWQQVILPQDLNIIRSRATHNCNAYYSARACM